MGLSRNVSKIDSDFSRKSQNFPTACILRPAEGVPLELGIGARVKKTRMMGQPGRQRSLTISSAVRIESTNVTDRQTDTGPDQRPRLRVASCGKKISVVDFYSASTRSVSKELRYSTHCQEITQIYLHTLRFIRSRNELYLPLPSQPQLVLIYRSRRDGRLSKPWCG